MSGSPTADFTTVAEFEKLAQQKLPAAVWKHLSAPGERSQTWTDNCQAFRRYRLIPRNLRDVYIRDTSVTVLGSELDFPVGIAPTAHHHLVHPEAESATVKGAAAMNTCFVLSSWSNRVLEEVAAAAPSGVRWFYMIFHTDRSRMVQLLRRAERAGFTAIVLTVDSPFYHFSFRKKPSSKLEAIWLPNMFLQDVPPGAPGSLERDDYLRKTIKESATWEDVAWVKKNTSLPIVCKGILSAEDAKITVQLGIDAILVSNHGGRQLDGVPATIDVLADIVGAVNGSAQVYLDGGVRTGTDVLKALALGARCVFIGRPGLWGLACNGAEGVQQVLQILKDELSLAMARAGCAKISDIQSSLVVHQSRYGIPSAKY